MFTKILNFLLDLFKYIFKGAEIKSSKQADLDQTLQKLTYVNKQLSTAALKGEDISALFTQKQDLEDKVAKLRKELNIN